MQPLPSFSSWPLLSCIIFPLEFPSAFLVLLLRSNICGLFCHQNNKKIHFLFFLYISWDLFFRLSVNNLYRLLQDIPLEKGMATHSNIIAWRIPWTEEPGRLQSTESQRVGHNWLTGHACKDCLLWLWDFFSPDPQVCSCLWHTSHHLLCLWVSRVAGINLMSFWFWLFSSFQSFWEYLWRGSEYATMASKLFWADGIWVPEIYLPKSRHSPKNSTVLNPLLPSLPRSNQGRLTVTIRDENFQYNTQTLHKNDHIPHLPIFLLRAHLYFPIICFLLTLPASPSPIKMVAKSDSNGSLSHIFHELPLHIWLNLSFLLLICLPNYNRTGEKAFPP